MAHFAEIDENNVVLRVIVVATKDNSDANGVEKESIGKAFCERLFGGNWVQTSYNGNIRGRYAGIGYKYDPVLDEFIAPESADVVVSPVDGLSTSSTADSGLISTNSVTI